MVKMVIEPRQAEPRAIWRWSRQAIQLVGRGFSFWLGLTALVCLWMFMGQRLPILDAILALSTFFASILIAAQLDRQRFATLSDVLAMLRVNARSILLFSTVIAIAGALIWILLLSRPEVPWWNAFYTERHQVVEFSPELYKALRQIFVYAAYALGLCYFGLNIPGLTSFFQFPCVTLLGLSFRQAYFVSADAQVRNMPAILSIGLTFMLLPIVWVLLLPPLVPLLYAFFGALAYVSFREIFLGVGENQCLVPAAKPVMISP